MLGRSHRAPEQKARLKYAIDRTHELLELPGDYLVAIVPASDTGAFELAMWNLLGARGVDALAWESFGKGWVTDICKQLRLEDVRVLNADYGDLPDLAAVDFSRDVVFTWKRHDLRRARAGWQLDCTKSRWVDALRCDLCGLRAVDRLGENRCRDIFLAEGVGRGGTTRHAGALAEGCCALGELSPALADAENFPHHEKRQAERRHLHWRHDQHALHALS